METNKHNQITLEWALTTLFFVLEISGAALSFILMISKFANLIDISWFWISFPVWILPAVVAIGILIVYLIALPCIFALMDDTEK